MSILIKEMAMPKSCEECYFDAGGYCLAKSLDFLDWCEVNDRPRPSWCPITEVPPHGDLIDRKALCEDIEQSVVFSARSQKQNAEIRGAFKVYDRIKVAPIVVESVE